MGSVAIPKPLSEVEGPPVPTQWDQGMYEALIEDCFVKHASRDAIVSVHQTSDPLAHLTNYKSGPVTWTFGHLAQAAKLLAARLRELGHQDDDKLVVILPNQVEWALLFCTALVLRTTFVPLFPNVMTNSVEAEHMFKTIGSATMFVKDLAGAEAVEASLPTQMHNIKIRCVVDQSDEKSGWLALGDLLKPSTSSTNSELVKSQSSFSIVFFTSGTTSLPKACVHDDAMLVDNLNASIPVMGYTSADRFCQPLPSNHIFGVDILIWLWGVGGAIVFPSIAFNPGAALRALEVAHCTVIALVPTMLHAMLEHPDRPRTNTSHLRQIIAGAATIPKALVERAMSEAEGFGVERFVAGYGMTEANYAIFCTDDLGPSPVEGDLVRTGVAVPGAKARICKPGTRELVPRGERGDLHNGGFRVVHGYLNADSSCFYQDDKDPNAWWIMSGDQAEMNENGVITVIGRYKDLIIRGGENISPASIESILDTVEGVKSQVVGYPDEVAGEVPVYVIWTAGAFPAPTDQLLDLVRDRMGSRYIPKAVLHIKLDLGHDVWPLTSSGKPKKAEISKLVKAYLEAKEQEENIEDEDTLLQVAKIWASLSGSTVVSLLKDQQCDLGAFADSLMIMQFVSLVKKKLKKVVTVADLAIHPTLEAQARFIDTLPTESIEPKSLATKRGPPKLADMVHCQDEVTKAATVTIVNEVIEPLGLSWEQDVEAIVPAYDFARVLMRRLRPQSWNHRQEFLTSQANVNELRTALEAMLAVQPMLRTIGVQLPATDGTRKFYSQAREGGELLHEGDVAHVVVRPSKHYFDLVIRDGFEIERPEDLYTFLLDDPILDHAAWPGPLVRFCLVKITSTGTAGLLLQGNHSAFDASSMSFLDDLLQILERGMSSVHPHADYKRFADLYYLQRKGPSATSDAAIFADRLQGSGRLVKENLLWPKQIAPEWFHGNFSSWNHSDGRPGKASERLVLDKPEDKAGVYGVSAIAHLPSLPELKAKHNIPASMVFKAACAIFNIRHTTKMPPQSTTEAFFSSTVAARTWPFVSDYSTEQSEDLPDIMDLPGPTVECTINRIPVSPTEETSLSFMSKVHALQDADSSHAHAPLSTIRSLLAAEDAQYFTQLLRRQMFNWLPFIVEEHDFNTNTNASTNTDTIDNTITTSTPKEPPIKLLRFAGRDDFGIRWNAGLLNSSTSSTSGNSLNGAERTHVKLTATYDDCQLTRQEMQANVAEFLKIATWLSDRENWGRLICEMDF